MGRHSAQQDHLEGAAHGKRAAELAVLSGGGRADHLAIGTTSPNDHDLRMDWSFDGVEFDEETWYFGLSTFGPKTPTPSFYRAAMRDLRKFNVSLGQCDAIFDGRSDNMVEFLDRIANDLGNTYPSQTGEATTVTPGAFVSRSRARSGGRSRSNSALTPQ